MNITGKIQKLRKERGWTITHLAKVTGIPTVSIRVMLSRDDPNGYTIKNLAKIAEALGVTVSYLTLEDNEREAPSLTATQRDEFKALIIQTIDQYFSMAVPNASANMESQPPKIRKTNYEELED